MKLSETTFNEYNISDITKKAIEKNGLGSVFFINAKVQQNESSCELLFEVESSIGDPKHVDMKGNPNDKTKRGYTCVAKFVNIPEDVLKAISTSSGFEDMINECDVLVHCDDPSFYWQGAHEEDSKKNNTRFGFQGHKGSGMWSLMHKEAGGKEGERLCKHLYAVREYILKNINGLAKQVGKSFKYEEKPKQDSTESKQKINSKGNEVSVKGPAPNSVDVKLNGGKVKESLLLKYLR